jgi:hypothetical protein
MKLQEIGWGWGNVDWIQMAQNRDKWLELSNTAIISCSITCEETRLFE